MNFYSIQFITFLVIAVVCYYTIFQKKQWICLLTASMVFYYWTGIENFLFLFFTGITTWTGAKYIGEYSEKIRQLRKDKTLEKEEKKKQKAYFQRKRQVMMWTVLLLNFGVLALLKYVEPILEAFGVMGQENTLGLLLPLGISFYTFQSISYLLDIYNEKYEYEKSFTRYLLFVSYFPQMIQGPINRYQELGVQFLKEHVWEEESATKAIYKIGYGLLKKYAIANIFAVAIANIFDTPARDFSGAMAAFGILLYSAQQYADFSGGIDVVLGVSELFGIKMADNFRQPYFSTSLADFWRRWHISLGHWMRDYLFYPFALTKPMKNFGKWANKRLGKHLGRVLPAAIGNIVVFLVVGIWHGAQWNYVLWGLYNGLVIALSDILGPVYDKIAEVMQVNRKAKWYHIFSIIRTFLVVNIGWYFDRIADIEFAFYNLKKTFTEFHAEQFASEYTLIFEGAKEYAVWLAVLGCVIVFCISVMKENQIDVRQLLYQSPVAVRWSVYLFMIVLILFSCTRIGETGGFMYANF